MRSVAQLPQAHLEKVTLESVLGQVQRNFLCGACLLGSVKAAQEVSPGGGEVTVAGELGLAGQCVKRIQAGGRAVGETDRYDAVERDDRRGPDLNEQG